MASELRECPWCQPGTPMTHFADVGYWAVTCGCGAEGPACETEAEAIAAWNRRATPQDGAVSEAAKELVRWALSEGSFQGNDIDGGAAQDKAESLGLIETREVTEPCGENCSCAEFGLPTTCYRFVAAIAARGGRK